MRRAQPWSHVHAAPVSRSTCPLLGAAENQGGQGRTGGAKHSSGEAARRCSLGGSRLRARQRAVQEDGPAGTGRALVPYGECAVGDRATRLRRAQSTAGEHKQASCVPGLRKFSS